MCRAVAVKVAEGQAKDHEVIDPVMVEEVLGPKKFVSEVAERVGEPGVATGLAWTAVGGDILFIATANQLDPIPWALRDRLEIIELPGYTRQEKKMIARKFLVPKQLDDHGLTNDRCEITDDGHGVRPTW